MTAERSFLEDLKLRRVPQIVGVYVAASWLVIELGDWVTGRFSLPPNLTSYVFVAMLTMLPAIALFAYNHGAPGRDRWTSTEKFLIPLNALLTVVVLYIASPYLAVEAATQTVRIPDETGVMQEFQVARKGYHKEVTAFFWQNDSGDPDLDWLSYGLPLMLAYDLNRVSPVIDVDTPFDSAAIREELRDRGFDALLAEPTALQVQIARDRRNAALIDGSFAQDGDETTINVTLIDAFSGSEIGSHSVTGGDWLSAVDDTSLAILDYLDIDAAAARGNGPVSQHFSSSLNAIRHFTNSQLALDINNDYPQAIAELNSAVELDPDFAEAHGELSTTYYLNGDIDAAREAASRALQTGYRLSQTSKFVIKANRYIYGGDFERGERVIDIWTQVQPNSTHAFGASVQLALLRGGNEALDKADAALDRLLELEPTNYDIYRQKAELEQQRGDYGAAAALLNHFLEFEPDSSEAHLQLANVHQATGDLDTAQETLEDALILSDNPLASELALARLEARRGLYGAAEQRLARQLNEGLNMQQQFQVLAAQAEVALVRGQITRTMALLAELSESARTTLPPMVRLVNIENQRPNLMILLDRTEEALAYVEEIRAQLQPPLDSYLNFTYTAIYRRSDNREEFRRWAEKTRDAAGHLPEIFQTFIEVDAAQLAIWDEDFGDAVDYLDRAGALIDQSLLQVLQNNLSTSALHVQMAELYLEAAAPEKARSRLEAILKVFPAHAYAQLVLAKVYLARQEEVTARELLESALEIWSEADAAYIHRREAGLLLEQLAVDTKA